MNKQGEEEYTFLAEDLEMKKIMETYLCKQIHIHGQLDVVTREMLILAVLTANHDIHMLPDCVQTLLNCGVKQEVIKEVMYHVIPYAGLGCVNEALMQINKWFKQHHGIAISTPATHIQSKDQFNKGMAIQSLLFSKEVIQNNHTQAAAELKHIQMALTTHCFGDFYTRAGLDLKHRELITFCVIASLGGCESQLRAHVKANLVVANTRNTLIDAITQCQPYIGFPRTLNAIAIIEDVCVKVSE